MKKTAALLIASLACSPAYALSLGDILKSIFNTQKQESSKTTSSSTSSNSSSSKTDQQKLDELRHTMGILKKITWYYNGYNFGVDPNAVFDFADPEQTVCDPLSDTKSDSRTSGLAAKLYVPSADMSVPVSGVMDYYNKGTKLDQNLYFASINVPTRLFTKGFVTEGGSVLVDASGNKLIENFAIEYNSILKLSDTDKEGEYELGSIADDGARIFFKENNLWKELINNDGNHASRFGCAYRTITMKKDTEVPIKVLYYQGPRYHIANVLMWKYHKDVNAYKRSVADNIVCGMQGNNVFYHPKNEKPTHIMKWLQSTGWKTIANANYKMPEQKTNPCAQEPLSISAVTATSVTPPTAIITWTTNYPSSSQLKISNTFTGEVIYTDLNTDLVTNHEVHLDGLVSGFWYNVQAISVDAKGNQVVSDPYQLSP